ncbi:MAG: DUF368 domain-containing protein, partial [Chloroflexota bacterium]|nr:DUF368 domain-containing protein [Chloroflexota bacterium]
SILLILGTYESTINAVNEMDLSYLLLFLSGGIAGFLAAIMLIKIILDQYKDEFRIIISGLIIGASIGLLYDLPKNSYLDLSLYIIFISGVILALILIKLTNYFTRNESNQN